MSASSWTRFWFERRSSQSLALLRIFFGFVLFQKMTLLHRFFPTTRSQLHVPHDDRLPSPDFGWLPVPSFELYQGLETLVLVLSVFFIMGLFSRVVAPLLALLYTYLFVLSQLTYSHHIFLFAIVLVVLGFSPCADHYSLDVYLFRDRQKPAQRSVLPIRLLQVMVSILYLFTALSHAKAGWLDGGFIETLFSSGRMDGALAPLAPLLGFRLLGLCALLVEGLLVFGLWVPRLRAASWFLGVALHLGIDMMMDVSTYSYQMMALYIVFISPVAGRNVVVFDGSCPLCLRSKRICNLLDWFRRFSWLDFRDPAVMAELGCLDAASLEQEMAVVEEDGEIHRGFEAWRAILCRMPLTFMFVWPLYVPPLPQLGRALYRFVAARRFGLVHCSDESCLLVAGGQTSGEHQPWRASLALANSRSDAENRAASPTSEPLSGTDQRAPVQSEDPNAPEAPKGEANTPEPAPAVDSAEAESAGAESAQRAVDQPEILLDLGSNEADD